MRRPSLLVAALAAFPVAPALAQPPVSGPLPGAPLAPVRVYAPSGPKKGEEFDAAAAIGKAPGALLFVHEVSRNVAPVLRAFDELAADYAVLGLRAFQIRLDDDRTRAESRMVTVSRALRLAAPILVSLDGAEGPGDYALDRKCTLTLVLAKDGKVHRSIGFTDTGAQDVPKLRGWFEEIAGPLPRTAEELRARLPADVDELRALVARLALENRRLRRELRRARENRGRNRRMRAGAGARRRRAEPPTSRPRAPAKPKTRRGGPPRDPGLQGLLRRIVRKTASAEEVDAAFAEIEAALRADPKLEPQVREMFLLLLSLDYGSEHARGRAKAWLETSGNRKGKGRDHQPRE